MRNSAVSLLDEAAARWPERPAVTADDGAGGQETLTYREYRARARRCGGGMLALGLGSAPVVVWLEKGIDALCCFFGAMYCGCPYAPVDAKAPLARLDKIVERLGPGLLVTDEARASRLAGRYPGLRVATPAALAAAESAEAALDAAAAAVIDTDPVYIIFTSGSTGTPKGVTIAHRGVLDYARYVTETFGFGPETVLANQSPFYFDMSVFDIFGCLYCGGRLMLIPEALLNFPSKLPEFLRDNAVTGIFWVPTVMLHVASSGALGETPLPALRTVCFAGEAMPSRGLNVWRAALPGRVFANLYGPTEITVTCCQYIAAEPMPDDTWVPTGEARPNMRVLLLTEEGREAAPGEQGELCVIGAAVALGYWNEPALTAAAFVPCPVGTAFGERMYRTGDLGYRDERGRIIFCGRRDSQIKLKGNRIELGEIEAAAAGLAGVVNAAALFDPAAEKIHLFVQGAAEDRTPLRKFNLRLAEHLPRYMLPGALHWRDALPLTPNGKIDRLALRREMEAEEHG